MDFDFPRHVGAVVVYQSDWGKPLPLVRDHNGHWTNKYSQLDDPIIDDLVMFDLRSSYPGYYPLCFDSIQDYVEYQSWMSLEKGLGMVCDEINKRKAS